MPREPHYDILFGPDRIGPVTAEPQMTEKVHAHGALAGAEIRFGAHGANLLTREASPGMDVWQSDG